MKDTMIMKIIQIEFILLVKISGYTFVKTILI